MRRGIDVPLSPALLFAVGESYLSSSSDDKDDTYSFDSYHDAEYDEACID
jgi:hypothetical protein